MKIAWPEKPTEQEAVKYFKALHDCLEDGVAKLGRRITLTSLTLAIGLVITVAGAAMSVANSIASWNAALKTLTEVVADQKAQRAEQQADQKAQSAKVDDLRTVQAVQGAKIDNIATALMGPPRPSGANRRPR